MKYLIILGDGMADEPIPRLGGRTPLQAARKPTIDRIAALGASGILDTVPEGFAPGSEIAHLSLLGYDVPSVFEGRGSLEAAGMGVEIGGNFQQFQNGLPGLCGDLFIHVESLLRPQPF